MLEFLRQGHDEAVNFAASIGALRELLATAPKPAVKSQ
jgi:hypothetical protein